MEEDNINSNEKLLNADDEYQEGRVPVQMLFKEKALRYASPYSLLCDDDEDVYGRTTESVKNASIEVNNFPLSSRDIFQTEYHETGERKKVRRRMIVSAGLMGVILVAMVTTSSFTLPHTPLSEKNNITSNSYFNFTEVSSTIGNKSAPEFEELANKHRIAAEQGDAEAQFHLGYMYENGQGVNQSDEEAIKWYNLAAEQGLAHAKTEKQQNKEMQMLSITLVGCIRGGMVSINRMMKLLDGSEKQQIKIMLMRNITLDGCFEMEEVFLNQKKKL
uniref:Sel1 repeat family protein n=1 Tax=Plectus sambesii TaxID=2011161 RepID=A0A914X6I9_9BILA